MSNATGGVPAEVITDDVHGTSAERHADASTTSTNRKRSPDDGAEGNEPVAAKRRASLKVDDDSDDSEESTAAAATATAAAAAAAATTTAVAPSQDKDEGKKPAAAAQKDQKTGGGGAAAAAAVNVDEDDDVDIDETVDFEKMQFTFPERLLDLLESGSVESAMRWLPPRGEAFCIFPKVFYDVVLLCHFQGTKFESFTRKLNRWGFKRLTGSVPQECIAYHHPLFKKDKPELLKLMRSGRNKYFVPAEVGGIAARDLAAQQQHTALTGTIKNFPLFDLAAAFKMGATAAASSAVPSAIQPTAKLLSNSARDRLAAQLSLQGNEGELNQRMLEEILRYQALQNPQQLLLPGSLAGVGASSQTCTPLHREAALDNTSSLCSSDGVSLSLRQLLASQQEQQEQQMKRENENLRKLLVAQQHQEQQNAAASQRSRDNERSLRQLLAAQQQQEQQNAAFQRSREHDRLRQLLAAQQQQQRENATLSQRNSGHNNNSINNIGNNPFTNLGAQQFLSSHRVTANDADLRLRQLLSQAGASAAASAQSTQDLLSSFGHRQGSSRGGLSSDAAAAASSGINNNNTPTDSQLLQLLFLQEQLERNRGGGP